MGRFFLLVLVLCCASAGVQPLALAAPRARGSAADKGTGSLAPETLYQQSWAVVIGIDTYQHHQIPALRYAVNDATSVAEALERMGFPRDHIVRLLNQQATKAALDEALYERLRGVGPHDRLFVFFAGHG